MNSKLVKMTMVSPNIWDLIGPKNNVIVGDLRLYSQYEAEEWVKAYISSFFGWSYVIVNKQPNKRR